MEKVLVHDGMTGEGALMYPQGEFMAECAGYCHDRTYRQFLEVQRARGATPVEAIAALRSQLGAMTKVEKRQAWLDQHETWRKAREAKQAAKKPVGRPFREMTAAEVQARIGAAILGALAKIEEKHLTDAARVIVASVKRQVLGASQNG